jgi:hypothetical protein
LPKACKGSAGSGSFTQAGDYRPPSKTIAENRNLEGGAKKPTSTGTAQGDLDLETRDAIASYRKAIADLDRAVQLDKHVALPGDTRAEIIDALTHHIETLNSL